MDEERRKSKKAGKGKMREKNDKMKTKEKQMSKNAREKDGGEGECKRNKER